MFQRAAIDYHIELHSSYMVGDRISDIEAGKNAGAKTVYISCRDGNRVIADFVYPTVLAFANHGL